eukprot:14031728-Alexandrium_andersonii.AAC.1
MGGRRRPGCRRAPARNPGLTGPPYGLADHARRMGEPLAGVAAPGGHGASLGQGAAPPRDSLYRAPPPGWPGRDAEPLPLAACGSIAAPSAGRSPALRRAPAS